MDERADNPVNREFQYAVDIAKQLTGADVRYLPLHTLPLYRPTLIIRANFPVGDSREWDGLLYADATQYARDIKRYFKIKPRPGFTVIAFPPGNVNLARYPNHAQFELAARLTGWHFSNNNFVGPSVRTSVDRPSAESQVIRPFY